MLACCFEVALVAILVWIAVAYVRPMIHVSLNKRAVFITGCDTGFGNLLTKHLDKMGVRVFAGCLAQSGVDTLKKECSSRVVPLLVDVTNEEQVYATAKKVESMLDGDHLWGIVNNAGISDGFFLDFTPLSAYRRTFDVNLFGMVAVTRAFLPMLKQSQGRVVNIASLAGRIAAPGMGAYAASKFAVEGFSDSLRRELNPWGIKVSIIEPGFFKTPLVVESAKRSTNKLIDSAPQSLRDEYGPEFMSRMTDMREQIVKNSGDPIHVVYALADALISRIPKHRYLVGTDANVIVWLTYLPSEIMDLLLRFRSPGVPAAVKARKQ